MAQPYDFSLANRVDPVTFNDFSMGVQNGQAMVSNNLTIQAKRDALVQQRVAAAQAQIAAQEQAKAQAQLKAELLAESQQEGGPTALGLSRIVTRHPQLADAMKDNIAGRGKAEQEQLKNQLTSTFVRSMNGDIEGAAVELEDAAAAYENSPGREADAKPLRDFAKLLRDNPNAAKTTMGIKLATVLGPDYEKIVVAGINTDSSVAKAGADAVKADAEAKIKGEEIKIKATEAQFASQTAIAGLRLTKAQGDRLYAQSANDARRLDLDRDALAQANAQKLAELEATAGKLPPEVFKEVNDTVRLGASAGMQAMAAEDLAKKFQAYDDKAKAEFATTTASGARSWAIEGVKQIAGFEDEVSAIRKQFNALVADNVIKNLPPGAASDKDISLIQGGFPSENSSPQTLVNFLGAVSRVQRAAQASRNDESEYLARNRSLGVARVPMTINGIAVNPGESYGQFVAKRAAFVAPEDTE